MFKKKDVKVEEQIMQEITDEQLDQVTGGGLLNTLTSGNVLGAVSTVTGTATQTLNSVSVSGIQVQVAGVCVSTPGLSTSNLL